MGKAYEKSHPDEPYDLSDPAGIAQELAQEAASDAKEFASELSGTLAANLGDATENIQNVTIEAYDHPSESFGRVVKYTRDFARKRPFEALLISAAVAIIAGRLFSFTAAKRSV